MTRARAVYDMVLQDKSAVGRRAFLGSLDSIDNRAAAMAVGGVAALGVAGATAFTLMYNAQAPLIDALGKLSESTDIGVEKLQAMQDAAERAGVPIEALNGSLLEGLKRISEAAGGAGEAGKILAEIGLSAEDLRQQAPEEQILDILTALEGVENVNDRIKFADKIFGGQGVSLIRLTTGAINEAEQEMRDLDLALSEINVGNVEFLNDQLQRIGRFTSQSSKVFVAEMAPAISAVLSETLALDSGMLSARSTAQLLADSTITATGFLGDGINGLKNSYSFVELQLQRLNVQANEFQARIAPTPEAIATLEKSREILQQMDDTLAGSTGALSYSERLRRAYDSQAEAAQQALEEQRKALEERQKLLDAINSQGGAGGVLSGGGAGKPEDQGDDIEAEIRKQVQAEEERARADDERAIASLQRDIDRRREYALTEEQLLLEEQERTAAILDGIAARDITRTDEVNALKSAANQQYHDEYLELAKERAEEQAKRDKEAQLASRSYLEQGIAHFAQRSEAADVLHKALVARRMFREGREAVIGAYKWGNSIAGPAGGAVAAAIAGAYTAALISETVGGGQSTPTAPTADITDTSTTSLSDSASSAAQSATQQTVVYNAYFPATPEAERESTARKQLDDDIRSKRIVIDGGVDVQVNVFDYEEFGT